LFMIALSTISAFRVLISIESARTIFSRPSWIEGGHRSKLCEGLHLDVVLGAVPAVRISPPSVIMALDKLSGNDPDACLEHRQPRDAGDCAPRRKYWRVTVREGYCCSNSRIRAAICSSLPP
jgi:hypothetical protein